MSPDPNFLQDLRDAPWVKPRFPLFRRNRDPEDVLAAIYSGDDEVSLCELNLTDQGDKLENAEHAIPFLVRLLPLVTDGMKVQLLDLLTHLAVGWEDECLGPLFVRGCSVYDESCYSLVHRGVEQYIELLASNDEEVKLAAFRILAWFPNSAKKILPSLRSCPDEALPQRETCLVARGLLEDPRLNLISTPPKLRYISNTARIFPRPPTEEDLQIVTEMSGWLDSIPISEAMLCPFELDLAWWTAEAIRRHSTETLKKLVRNLPGGLLRLKCEHSLAMQT